MDVKPLLGADWPYSNCMGHRSRLAANYIDLGRKWTWPDFNEPMPGAMYSNIGVSGTHSLGSGFRVFRDAPASRWSNQSRYMEVDRGEYYPYQ